MSEKLDDFFCRYIEQVDSGITSVGELLGNSFKGVVQLLRAVFGMLVIVISFPLWVIGKLSAQHRVQSDAATPSQAVALCPHCGKPIMLVAPETPRS